MRTTFSHTLPPPPPSLPFPRLRLNFHWGQSPSLLTGPLPFHASGKWGQSPYLRWGQPPPLAYGATPLPSFRQVGPIPLLALGPVPFPCLRGHSPSKLQASGASPLTCVGASPLPLLTDPIPFQAALDVGVPTVAAAGSIVVGMSTDTLVSVSLPPPTWGPVLWPAALPVSKTP